MIYDLKFNGYRLDHRRASKFDAFHADEKQPMPPGYYELSTPPTAPLTNSFFDSDPLMTSSLGTEYALRPVPSRNSTPAPYYLFDGSAKVRAGIRVDSTFFYAARSFAVRGALDHLVLCVDYSAPWMRTALLQLGTKEKSGPKAHPQILEYFKASGWASTDDSGSENAWCASFVTWVMKQHGYARPSEEHSYRALEWEKFGKKITDPVYGAIGVKKRATGGHVAFVAGKSSDGKYLCMLGGNQDNEVQVFRYDKTVWRTFVVPADYNSAAESLPVYPKSVKISGAEA